MYITLAKLALKKGVNTQRRLRIRLEQVHCKFSDETRVKLGGMSVEVTDIETNETTFYISASSAAAAIECDRKTIVSRIRSNSLTPINNRFIVKPSK